MTLQAVDTVKLNESDLKAERSERRAEMFSKELRALKAFDFQGGPSPRPKADPIFGLQRPSNLLGNSKTPVRDLMKPRTVCRIQIYPCEAQSQALVHDADRDGNGHCTESETEIVLSAKGSQRCWRSGDQHWL